MVVFDTIKDLELERVPAIEDIYGKGGPCGPASDERRTTKGNSGSTLFRPPISDAFSFLQTHKVSERFILDSIWSNEFDPTGRVLFSVGANLFAQGITATA
jgi:hypothetical protein